MKSSLKLAVALVCAARSVVGHATFQQLWVDGVDYGTQCARAPQSNNPVTNVAGRDVICNVGGLRGVGSKCPVPAGSTVTVEMHQQPGDRACNKEAIGGQHYGPVMVYLTKVPDAAAADGSTGWFKIFQDSWSSTGAMRGDDDNWGVKDLNDCCGRMDVPIPEGLEDGDYLLRAEVIALHVGGQPSGAQLYMTCYQITVEGGSGTLSPSTVKFPGAYTARDPGILVDIHSQLQTYVAPGPDVIPEGTTKKAGSGCTGECEKSCKVGSGPAKTLAVSEPPAAAGGAGGAAGGGGGCAAAAWQQCGGTGYTGCTSCASGRCVQMNPYYHQCQG